MLSEPKLEVKDFRDTDVLERCLAQTLGHMMVMTSGIIYQKDQRQWINRAEANLDGIRKALQQVRKIAELAKKTGNQELLALLDEKFLFCDSPELRAHERRVSEHRQ